MSAKVDVRLQKMPNGEYNVMIADSEEVKSCLLKLVDKIVLIDQPVSFKIKDIISWIQKRIHGKRIFDKEGKLIDIIISNRLLRLHRDSLYMGGGPRIIVNEKLDNICFLLDDDVFTIREEIRKYLINLNDIW